MARNTKTSSKAPNAKPTPAGKKAKAANPAPRATTMRGAATTGGAATSGRGGAAQAAPSDEEIRQRAFDIWRERGGAPGSPEDDWARAERELRGAS